MKKIVIINQDAGYLMIDLANAFVDDNYEVTLITGRLVQRNTPLNQEVKLVKIIRYRRNNIFSKVISWLIGVFQIMLLIWLKFRGHYLLIVSNPPLAPLLPLTFKNPYSLLIYDVYIETPEKFTLLKSRSLLVKLWKKVHIKVLSGAGKIFTLTDGMSSQIEKYARGKKCEVVPIWTDNEFLQPLPVEINPFIAKHNLHGKFIILYSGSIGESSGMEYLIDIASIVENNNIVFLIIGEGSRKPALVKKIRNMELSNCLLLPWQEASVLPYSLASANIAVVTLSGESSHSAIPSKLFNYMSVGAPILCLADPKSDLGQLIETEKIGRCFKPDLNNEIAMYINYLSNHSEVVSDLKINSLNLSKSFSKENVNRFVTEINNDFK